MIFAAVGFLAVAVGLVAYTVRAQHAHTQAWLAYLRHRDVDARNEREVLYRVLLSRSASEFGSLDRIRQVERNANARPAMTRDEYEQMLRDDMAGMGFESDVVPAVPEGL